MSPPVALSADEFYTDIPVGEILRRARVQHGLSLRDAETHLHIRIQHLEALERSDFNALPGQVYVVGFIRTYAEFLGLDGARVIHVLKRQSRGLGTPQSLNAHILPSDSRLPSVSMMAASSALFLLLLVFWIAYQSSGNRPDYMLPAVPEDVRGLDTLEFLTGDGAKRDDELFARSPDSKPVEQKSAAPQIKASEAPSVPPVTPLTSTVSSPNAVSDPVVPTSDAGGMVSIALLDDSWIELRAPGGDVVSARLYKKGERFRLAKPTEGAGRSYTMTVSNAAAIEIRVGSAVIPTLGKVGEVRRNVSLDPRMLKLLMGAQ